MRATTTKRATEKKTTTTTTATTTTTTATTTTTNRRTRALAASARDSAEKGTTSPRSARARVEEGPIPSPIPGVGLGGRLASRRARVVPRGGGGGGSVGAGEVQERREGRRGSAAERRVARALRTRIVLQKSVVVVAACVPTPRYHAAARCDRRTTTSRRRWRRRRGRRRRRSRCSGAPGGAPGREPGGRRGRARTPTRRIRIGASDPRTKKRRARVGDGGGVRGETCARGVPPTTVWAALDATYARFAAFRAGRAIGGTGRRRRRGGVKVGGEAAAATRSGVRPRVLRAVAAAMRRRGSSRRRGPRARPAEARRTQARHPPGCPRAGDRRSPRRGGESARRTTRRRVEELYDVGQSLKEDRGGGGGAAAGGAGGRAAEARGPRPPRARRRTSPLERGARRVEMEASRGRRNSSSASSTDGIERSDVQARAQHEACLCCWRALAPGARGSVRFGSVRFGSFVSARWFVSSRAGPTPRSLHEAPGGTVLEDAPHLLGRAFWLSRAHWTHPRLPASPPRPQSTAHWRGAAREVLAACLELPSTRAEHALGDAEVSTGSTPMRLFRRRRRPFSATALLEAARLPGVSSRLAHHPDARASAWRAIHVPQSSQSSQRRTSFHAPSRVSTSGASRDGDGARGSGDGQSAASAAAAARASCVVAPTARLRGLGERRIQRARAAAGCAREARVEPEGARAGAVGASEGSRGIAAPRGRLVVGRGERRNEVSRRDARRCVRALGELAASAPRRDPIGRRGRGARGRRGSCARVVRVDAGAAERALSLSYGDERRSRGFYGTSRIFVKTRAA